MVLIAIVTGAFVSQLIIFPGPHCTQCTKSRTMVQRHIILLRPTPVSAAPLKKAGFWSVDPSLSLKTDKWKSPWVIKCPHVSHHPTIRYMVYNGYYKVMSNIPKMGHLPTPDHMDNGLSPPSLVKLGVNR